jgi:hypothetical protein
MQQSNAPTQLLQPFAASAGGAYIRTIPQTSSDPGQATFSQGWPAATFLAVAAGGALPDGRDMNEIHNIVTAAILYQQAGGLYQYNSTFSAAIGGYPNNAILAKASGSGIWQSVVDNNVTDPDTGGAGWVSLVLATAYQYPVPFAQRYGNTVTFTAVGDTPVMQFAKTSNQQFLMSIPITNNVDLTLPIKMLISYTGDVAFNNYDLQLQYQNIASGGLAANYTAVTDSLTAPSVAANMVNYTTVRAIIPAAALSANGIINCVLTRLANNILDTNTGNLQIINVTMGQ